MKAFLKRVNWNVVGGVVLVVAAAVILLRVFDVGTRWDLSRAVSQLLAGERTQEARRTLLGIRDRAMVLAALKEALESEEGSVRGKLHVAQALLADGAAEGWNEPRPVYRALESKVASTRRAAAFLLYSQPGTKEASLRVAMEWLRDAEAPERSLALQIVMAAKPPEAVPDILAIVRQPPRAGEDAGLVRVALSALGAYQPEGIAAEILAIAADPGRDPDVRGQAFRLLGRLPDADPSAAEEAMVKILLDRSGGGILRNMVAGELRRPACATPRTWDALEAVLKSPDEPPANEWVQRECLRSLGAHLPLDRLRALLQDRAVYAHPNFGVRSDVAAAMAPLLLRDKVSFDILCEMLVDEDARDRQFTVRQEAWISLWMLTARAFGAADQQKFVKIPALPAAPKRENVFAFSLGRGITEQQLAAVGKLVADLSAMQRVRQSFLQEWPRVDEEWKAEEAKRKAETAKREAEEARRKADEARPPELRRAVARLLAGEDPAEARQALRAFPDRAAAVEALAAALETELPDLLGKIRVAQALLEDEGAGGLGEPGPVRRALESGVASARRAAAFLLHKEPERKERCLAVALEWLRDAGAAERGLALSVVLVSKPPEALPDLLALVRQPPRSAGDAQLVRAALAALGDYQPEGIAPEILALATDALGDAQVRGLAFRLLSRLPDADAAAAAEAMATILLDRSESTLLRSYVAGELRRPAYASPRVWDALETVLKSTEEAEAAEWVQRECLRSLGEHLPLDRLRALLLDPAVTRHRNYGVRSDVATAMAPMLLRDEAAFDVLCRLLVDEDPDDRQFVVRLEAWISLWMLTGRAFGVADPATFAQAPPLPAMPRRERMFDFSLGRGITEAQLAALHRLLPDLEALRRARDSYAQERRRTEDGGKGAGTGGGG